MNVERTSVGERDNHFGFQKGLDIVAFFDGFSFFELIFFWIGTFDDLYVATAVQEYFTYGVVDLAGLSLCGERNPDKEY